MMILTRVAAGALVFFGIVHLALTGRTYQLSSAEALWFAGSGIMLIASGLLTLTASLPDARMARICSLIVNLLVFSLGMLAIPVLQEPHVYLLVGFVIAALLGVSGLMFKSDRVADRAGVVN